MNPWGDIIVMGRAWCLLKSGGRALIGVPTGNSAICFNSHKLYGSLMFKHVFANWKQLYWDVKEEALRSEPVCVSDPDQPLIVLEKP